MGRRKKHRTQAERQRAYRHRQSVTKNNPISDIVTRVKQLGWKFEETETHYRLISPRGYGMSFWKSDWELVADQVADLEAEAAGPKQPKMVHYIGKERGTVEVWE